MIISEEGILTEVNICDYASYSEEGLRIVHDDILELYDNEFEKTDEEVLEPNVINLFSLGY